MGRGIGVAYRSPFAVLVLSLMFPTGVSAEEYVLGADSMPQEGDGSGGTIRVWRARVNPLRRRRLPAAWTI